MLNKNKIEIVDSRDNVIKFDDKFVIGIDNIVIHADDSYKEFSETIKLIDNESKETGLSFYEVFYNLLTVLHAIRHESGARKTLVSSLGIVK